MCQRFSYYASVNTEFAQIADKLYHRFSSGWVEGDYQCQTISNIFTFILSNYIFPVIYLIGSYITRLFQKVILLGYICPGLYRAEKVFRKRKKITILLCAQKSLPEVWSTSTSCGADYHSTGDLVMWRTRAFREFW